MHIETPRLFNCPHLQTRCKRQRNRRKIYDPHDDPHNRRFIHQTQTRKPEGLSNFTERAVFNQFEQNYGKMYTKRPTGYYTRFLSNLCFDRNIWSSPRGSQNTQMLKIGQKLSESKDEDANVAAYKVLFVLFYNIGCFHSIFNHTVNCTLGAKFILYTYRRKNIKYNRITKKRK